MSSSVMGLPSHMSGFLYPLGPPSSGVYSYVSYPTVLPNSRPRYRNEQAHSPGSSGGVSSTGGAVNIMHDRRVVRGNTYGRNNAHLRSNWSVTPNDDVIKQRQAERNGYIKKRMLPSIGRGGHHNNGFVPSKLSASSSSAVHRRDREDLRADRLLSSDARYTAARARVRKRLAHYQREDASAADAGGSRKNLKVQTEQWLEEIKDRTPEVDVGVQTEETGETTAEAALPMPTEAEVPPGVDKATQIVPDDPDLFDFDVEVSIVLDAMVGKTVEQSLLEVIDEEETAALEGLKALCVAGALDSSRLIKAA